MSKTHTDYLVAAYRMYENGIPVVGPTDISRSMGVNKATAYEALRALADMGYGEYIKRKGLVLGTEGVAAGKEAIRRHRLLELHLHETLGIPSEIVCCEAKRLDPYMGDALIQALEARYGSMTVCPCGNAIPERCVGGKEDGA